MTLRIVRTCATARVPAYSHADDAGMDLCASEACVIAPHARALVHTGLIFELPPNVEAQVRPRSGLALRHGLTVLNSPGTIDPGYRGEVGVILINHGDEPFTIDVGMKIAQVVFAPVCRAEKIIDVETVSETARGVGGFGSTGV